MAGPLRPRSDRLPVPIRLTEFHANFFPIPAPNRDCDFEALRDLVAVPGTDKKEYYELIIDGRIRFLRDLLAHIRHATGEEPSVFVMVKTDIWGEGLFVEKVAQFVGADIEAESAGQYRYAHSSDKKVWFTYHPRHPAWSNSRYLDAILCKMME